MTNTIRLRDTNTLIKCQWVMASFKILLSIGITNSPFKIGKFDGLHPFKGKRSKYQIFVSAQMKLDSARDYQIQLEYS